MTISQLNFSCLEKTHNICMESLFFEVDITTYLTIVYGLENQTNLFEFTLNASFYCNVLQTKGLFR